MKNNGRRPALGPGPVQPVSAGVPLSRQRAAVLDRLREDGSAATVIDLAGELGVHPNTVREHLEALVEAGLATRERAAARGRGRPAWRYAAAAGEPDPRVRDYAGLATALAGHLERVSADPAADGVEVGRRWGRELAAGGPAPAQGRATGGPAPAAGRATGGPAPEAERATGGPAPAQGRATGGPAPAQGRATRAGARHRVVELLAELGFDPRADPRATTVALRRCPLLDAARQHPNVICQVHLGIVRGALEVYRGDPEATALLPFAEPGACRLHLATATACGG